MSSSSSSSSSSSTSYSFHNFLISIIVIFVFFVVVVISDAAASSDVDLIKETCIKSSKTDPNVNYNFCVESLQEAVPRCHRMDLKGLGVTAMRLAEANATRTHLLIRKLLKSKEGGTHKPYCKSCLEDCLDLFADAISTLKDAIKDFTSKHYSEASIKVSAAMDASTTCEDGFKEQGMVSPLSKNDKDMFQLTALALSIINRFLSD